MELGKDSWMDMANRLRNGGPSALLARFALMLAGNAALADLLEHAANSDKDSLTHIRNRGALEEDIKELLLSPESGALIVIDLVNFGQVNNQRGQSGGDKLLQIIAEGLTRVTSRRRNDIIYTQHSRTEPSQQDEEGYRVGGDEFVALLKNGDSLKNADIVAITHTKLRQILEDPAVTEFLTSENDDPDKVISLFGIRAGACIIDANKHASYADVQSDADPKLGTVCEYQLRLVDGTYELVCTI